MKRISDEEIDRRWNEWNDVDTAAMAYGTDKPGIEDMIKDFLQAQLDADREEVKEILKEIEEHLTLTYDSEGSMYSISKLSWQALKQEVLKCQR